MSEGGMRQQCGEHDYCAPCRYLVTVVTEPRRHCLSEVQTGRDGVPEVLLSPVGEVVREAWRRLGGAQAGVEGCEYVVMPDHFHGILWVRERLEQPAGHIVEAFKREVEQACRQQGLLRLPRRRRTAGALPPPLAGPGGAISGEDSAAPAFAEVAEAAGRYAAGRAAPAPGPTLWAAGCRDAVLRHRGQVQAMVRYLADNPRRLLLKRARPDLFTSVAELPVCPGLACPAIGNPFLLDYPIKRCFQVSRRIPPGDLALLRAELLAAAAQGTVLVSACISPGEKEIAHAAMDAGRPLIVLLANGLPPRYRPPGRTFEACAAGRLLMVAPFPHQGRPRGLNRDLCLTLNGYAQAIAADPPEDQG